MSRYSIFEKYYKFFPKKIAKTMMFQSDDNKDDVGDWVPGEFYYEPKSFKKRVGNFLLFYEFRDPRPEEENYLYKSKRSRIDGFNYSGFRKHLLSDFIIKNHKEKFRDFLGSSRGRSDMEPDLIRCPCCGSKGYIDHGWRVQCSVCDTWMESYGNSLNTWGNILRKKKTPFGDRFYHKGSKITEEEFNSWSVYYKLLFTTENQGS